VAPGPGIGGARELYEDLALESRKSCAEIPPPGERIGTSEPARSSRI
jgi:hypothetical protein